MGPLVPNGPWFIVRDDMPFFCAGIDYHAQSIRITDRMAPMLYRVLRHESPTSCCPNQVILDQVMRNTLM
ncbi:MAG: hypothetical protein ACYSYM_11045 [Planctomycetota bacterium]